MALDKICSVDEGKKLFARVTFSGDAAYSKVDRNAKGFIRRTGLADVHEFITGLADVHEFIQELAKTLADAFAYGLFDEQVVFTGVWDSGSFKLRIEQYGARLLSIVLVTHEAHEDVHKCGCARCAIDADVALQALKECTKDFF